MSCRSIYRSLILTLLAVSALILILYPYISNVLFEHRADSLIQTLKANSDEQKPEDELARVRQYNKTLAQGRVQLSDPFDEAASGLTEEVYQQLCYMTDDGVMGYIEIPSIEVNLPIYHGTSPEVLEKGIGHLLGTSLPIGGEGTHAVLTGHTGLSNARLFTDLTELTEGDLFFLHVMKQDLAYEVSDIRTVLPSELDTLEITAGADFCTLITCTPYGINSHRLLVRGCRTDYVAATDDFARLAHSRAPSKWMLEYQKSLLISFALFAVCLALMSLLRILRRHHTQNHT